MLKQKIYLEINIDFYCHNFAKCLINWVYFFVATLNDSCRQFQTDDSTVLRHSVKALVKEPALSDGRIRPGDKLVAANGIECGHLSHQELIQVINFGILDFIISMSVQLGQASHIRPVFATIHLNSFILLTVFTQMSRRSDVAVLP